MKRLIWTKKQPTEPGWYWKRRARKHKRTWGEKDDIVYIRDFCGELCISNWPIPSKDMKWAGPILKPKTLNKKDKRNDDKSTIKSLKEK